MVSILKMEANDTKDIGIKTWLRSQCWKRTATINPPRNIKVKLQSPSKMVVLLRFSTLKAPILEA
ncbi:hypothetical protein LINGRAHAP2_LOCUS7072, partial [Linum grandiflorum]